MDAKPYLILKGGYVINRIMLVPGTPYIYPHEHDEMIEDTTENVSIGDWYEEAEGIFYRPINGVPPDRPSELG